MGLSCGRVHVSSLRSLRPRVSSRVRARRRWWQPPEGACRRRAGQHYNRKHYEEAPRGGMIVNAVAFSRSAFRARHAALWAGHAAALHAALQ